MATLDDINLFDRYLQAKNLQQDQRQEVADTIAPTPAQATYIAAMLAPGSGYIDAQGVFPSFPPSEAGMKDAFSGEPMPSMTQNLTEGNYLDLALQGLGVVGDTAYGIPLAGPFIGGGLKTASVLGAIAKANKSKEGIASLPPTLTRNPSKAEIKQNFIDQHPPVGSIDSKTGKPVTEQLIKNRANAFEKQLKVPAVRNREELRMSTTKISGVDEPLERIIKTPEDLLGKVLVPVAGDRSRVMSGGIDDIRGHSIDTKHTSARRSKLHDSTCRQWQGLGIYGRNCKQKTNEHDISRRRNWIGPLWRLCSHGQRNQLISPHQWQRLW
jgi:hypothetical protein